MIAIGVDIGGTAVKAGCVDTETGALIGERLRVATPHRGGPDAVGEVIAEVVAQLATPGPLGIGFPGPIFHGQIMTAPHLAQSWVGQDAPALFSARLGRECTVINDADAAGYAEMRCGAGQGHPGSVLMLTLGTGIGSALFVDGVLVPNLEFGHIEIDGADAEIAAAARARVTEDLAWDVWARRLSRYIATVDRLLWVDLVILGGEITSESDRFLDMLDVRPPIEIAQLRNAAGVIGAAMWAAAHGAQRT